MTSSDRVSGAASLRGLRESRGWSWLALAHQLRNTAKEYALTDVMNREAATIQRAVARWENSAAPVRPQERYQLLLAHLYARTPTGSLALGPGSDFAVLLHALRALGTPEHRVEQLGELVKRTGAADGTDLLAMLSPTIQTGVVTALRDPAKLEPALLSQLAQVVAAINGEVGTEPFVRLQLRLAPVVETCRRLERTEQPPSLGRSLLAVATTATGLAARLAFETRDDRTATTLYREATKIAGKLHDRGARATVGTSHTMVTLHTTGDVRAAREIARAAVTDAHRGADYAVRARAHAVHAELCARSGDGEAADVALRRAWKTIDQRGSVTTRNGFNADRLAGFEGLCALYGGAAEYAHDRLTRSLAALTSSRDAVQWGIVKTDLARARLRLGHPDACADLLHEAVDATARTGGRVAAQRIRQTRAELRPWRSEKFVADLDEHIYAALVG